MQHTFPVIESCVPRESYYFYREVSFNLSIAAYSEQHDFLSTGLKFSLVGIKCVFGYVSVTHVFS